MFTALLFFLFMPIACYFLAGAIVKFSSIPWGAAANFSLASFFLLIGLLPMFGVDLMNLRTGLPMKPEMVLSGSLLLALTFTVFGVAVGRKGVTRGRQGKRVKKESTDSHDNPR